MKKILFSLILLLTGSQATQVNPMICGPVMDSMKKDGPNVLASVDRVKATYEKEKEKYQYTNDNAKVRAAYDTFCQSKFMTELSRKQPNKYVTQSDLSDKKPASNYMKNILNHAYKALGINPENQLPLYSLEEMPSTYSVEGISSTTVGEATFKGIYINEKALMNRNIEHFTIYHEASHVKYNDMAIGVLLWKFLPESKLKTFFLQKNDEYTERRADLSALTIMKCGCCSEKLGHLRYGLSGKDYLNQKQIYAIAEQQKNNGKKCDYHSD